MKRVFKKLTAIALAGAMVLSLGASALATDSNTAVNNSNSPLQGTVTNEGPFPAEVLTFRVAAPTAGDFDLIVDPHDLIRESAKSEKTKAAYQQGSFEEGAYAFFKKQEDGDITFGKESSTLTVTNKSSTPITVQLNAKLNKGMPNADKITLVDTEAELATLAKKAGLYLAVKNGEAETPISQNAFGNIGVTVPADAADFITGAEFEWIDGVSNKLKKALNDSIDTTDTTSSGKTAEFAITVTAAVTTTGSEADGAIALAAPTDWGVASTTAGVSSDAAAKLAATNTSNTRVLTISVPDSGKAVPVAKITFYFNMAKVIAATAAQKSTVEAAKVTLTKWDGNPYANVNVQAENKEGAYSVQATGTAPNETYAYVLDSTIENDDFPKQTFNLKAAINRDDVWDSVGAGALSNVINVTWKIDQYIAPADPVLTVETPATKNGEVAEVSFTGGKGEYYVKDLLAVIYTADKATTIENTGKADAAGVPDTLKISSAIVTTAGATRGSGKFQVKVVSKMLGEGVPETTKAVFLMTNGTKVVVKEVPFDFSMEG